jgi:autotransporter-associated beta strand protein
VDDSTGGGSLVAGDNDPSSTFAGTIQNAIGAVALTKVGVGTLTLSGTSSYLRGTTVNDWALIATNSYAIADWTNLYVGDPGMLGMLPAAVVPSQSPVVSSAAVAPVPEPGTLLLLAAVLGSAAVWRPVSTS